MSSTQPMLRIVDVHRTHGGGDAAVHALRGVSLEVHPGELVAVMGPSGSGKSTLLNMIGLLDRPTVGGRSLLGIDVEGLSTRHVVRLRAHALGFVFQAFHLIPRRTVVENVALGGLYTGASRRVRDDRALAALDRVGMTGRRDALVDHLSGGERQRVAIARAVVNDPPLLLCDEPTGNLDTETSEQVLTLLGELWADGTTLVLVTHNPDIATRADQVLVVRDGRVVERAL